MRNTSMRIINPFVLKLCHEMEIKTAPMQLGQPAEQFNVEVNMIDDKIFPLESFYQVVTQQKHNTYVDTWQL